MSAGHTLPAPKIPLHKLLNRKKWTRIGTYGNPLHIVTVLINYRPMVYEEYINIHFHRYPSSGANLLPGADRVTDGGTGKLSEFESHLSKFGQPSNKRRISTLSGGRGLFSVQFSVNLQFETTKKNAEF